MTGLPSRVQESCDDAVLVPPDGRSPVDKTIPSGKNFDNHVGQQNKRIHDD
jgi:hypothetical protein